MAAEAADRRNGLNSALNMARSRMSGDTAAEGHMRMAEAGAGVRGDNGAGRIVRMIDPDLEEAQVVNHSQLQKEEDME